VKLGFGIPLVLVGLFTTIGGVALLAMVGADGRFTTPATRAVAEGYALIIDGVYIRGDLPQEGTFSTTVRLTVSSDQPVFVGIARRTDVARYLQGVPVDHVVQANWPGGVRTEPVQGDARPDAIPGRRGFWVASDEGDGERTLEWTVADGDWTIVVMNADGSRDVDVQGSLAIGLPILGPVAIGVLLLGILLLVAGVALTVSGVKTDPASARTSTLVDRTPVGAPPPRPDR
jgi:hypothetical protein